MATITTKDLSGLIALAIRDNRQAFIQAMNNNGNPVSQNMSGDDLLSEGQKVFNEKGLIGLTNVLIQVPFDKSKLTIDQQNILIKKFGLTVNPNAKCDFQHPLECLTGTFNYVGDLLGGHSTTVQPPTIITKTSVLPAWVVPTTAITGMIVIAILFVKNVKNALAISILIGVMVIGVILFGVFATKTEQTGGGGTTQSTGGIASAILAFFV